MRGDDSLIAFCLPVATTDPRNVVAGSTRQTCARCGQEIWLSPKTRARQPKELLCVECGLHRQALRPLPVVGPDEGQRRELIAHFFARSPVFNRRKA